MGEIGIKILSFTSKVNKIDAFEHKFVTGPILMYSEIGSTPVFVNKITFYSLV